MRRLVNRFKFRKEKAGQSIVLLAIGFIALIAFVGLVTDLSLLFVRYSALRRAVDSSAIAAAGQIREGRDYGDIAIVARQYIELHGLEPHRVFVETCETDIAAWRAGTGAWEGDPHPVGSFNVDDMEETELCQWQAPRKLVRVTAQIESPTTFLRMIGWNNIMLEATSVSETAVLDVALVLDTSATMVHDTTIGNYRDVFLSHTNEPGFSQMRPECYRNAPASEGGAAGDPDRLKWQGCCSDPGQGFIRQDPLTGEWRIWTDTTAPFGEYNPGIEDGVRTFTAGQPVVADNNFTDLICQPFKQVKDAARNFIRRLDFIRGDRVTLVTFAREAQIVDPINSVTPDQIMMTSEVQAMATLNANVRPAPIPGPGGVPSAFFDRYNRCHQHYNAQWDYAAGLPQDNVVSDPNGPYLPGTPDINPSLARYWSYESLAPCTDTNTGQGIQYANNALTNVTTIRRDAVWVIILLSDGAANATAPADVLMPTYGGAGFCPWNTFCTTNPADPAGRPVYPECTLPTTTNLPVNATKCNDNNPATRHFCLSWTNDPDTNGEPTGNPDCLQGGNYDADDFARDWADYAGLQEVSEGVEGNFVAMFTIGFGTRILTLPTAAPLLRYIADAGDNGFIDDNEQQFARGENPPAGDPIGPCEATMYRLDFSLWCGQYFYAENLRDLDAVFESIASRLFTRISR